jgi:hypothetical protein
MGAGNGSRSTPGQKAGSGGPAGILEKSSTTSRGQQLMNASDNSIALKNSSCSAENKRQQSYGTRGTVKLPHVVIVRASGLLPMRYTLSELGDELQISGRTLREWLDRGLPHTRDARGHIWIDGRQFAAWVQAVQQARLEKRLSEGQAYCVTCRRPVELSNPTSVRHGKQILLSGICPDCGNSIYRGSRHGQSK